MGVAYNKIDPIPNVNSSRLNAPPPAPVPKKNFHLSPEKLNIKIKPRFFLLNGVFFCMNFFFSLPLKGYLRNAQIRANPIKREPQRDG